jgi:hypothetical protein
MDVAADEYLLLLEDLDARQCGDEVAGCTVAAAELALTKLAEFHASWWEKDDSPRLQWMPYVNDPVHQSAQHSYEQAWPHFVQMFGEAMSPATRKLAEELQPHIIELLNLYERPPRTIIHGDYRLDNMFFNIADGSPLAVIDWQISSRGRGMFDVAYFISSSLEPDVRAAHEERLVRLWYETVCANTKVRGYTFDDVWRDYRTGVLYTHIYTVIGIGSLDSANERGMALFNKWMTRRLTAMEHLVVGEMMPGR